MSAICNEKQVLEVMHERHACKVMDGEKKIPENTFHTLLEVARLSPSSFGYEPWKLIVTEFK